jgi:hypothetical protein
MGSPLPGYAEFLDLGATIGLNDGDLTFTKNVRQMSIGSSPAVSWPGPAHHYW